MSDDYNVGVVVYTMPSCDKCDIVKEWLKENNIDFEEMYFSVEIQVGFIMNNLFGTPPIVTKDDLIYTAENLFDGGNNLNSKFLIDIDKYNKSKRKRYYYLGYVKCPICGLMGELRGNNTKKTNNHYYASVQHFSQKGGRGAKKKYLYKCYLGKIINGVVRLFDGSPYKVTGRKTPGGKGRRNKKIEGEKDIES